MSHPFFRQLYQHHDIDKLDIDLIICHVLGINRAKLFVFDATIDNSQQQRIHALLKERADGVPLAYLTGKKAFWTLDLEVNKHTLIPRPETELMVELLSEWTAENYQGNLLDLGTGTGAIALSFAQLRPSAQVTAVDFSQHCVDVATRNRDRYELHNVNILLSDWFSALNQQRFDFVVSNPPYIEENDQHLVDLRHEPISALTAKNRGLADLFHLIEHATKHLNHRGQILLEHGYDQHEAVQQHLQQHGYQDITSHRDLAGIFRITSARFLQS